MILRKWTSTAMAGLGLALSLSACGAVGGQEKVTMDDKQAVSRAEELVQQALGAMSPKPTLKRDGRYGADACLADTGASDRRQVQISYRFEGVPGSAGRQLVRQARDAWVALGYKFQSAESDGDWADPGTNVHMRTEPDDYWMTLGNSVTDRTTGDGVAYITVTSPCYYPIAATQSASSSARSMTADDASQHRVLGYSSRIYEALGVPHDAASGESLRMVENEGATYLHHAWATGPLAGDGTVRAIGRARAYLEDSGWRTCTAPGRLIALHPSDETLAQLATGPDGRLQIGVTAPAIAVLRTDA